MPRPRNMTAATNTQKRWMRLQAFIKKTHQELVKPLSHTQRKSTVVVGGRIINLIVCTFIFSEPITMKVLHELNACLMRMDSQDDVLNASKQEIAIINQMLVEVGSNISKITQDIEASRVFS